MSKRRRKRRSLWQDYMNDLAENLPSGFVVQPENPPGFGIQRPELRYETPLVTGQILFDDPFHTVLPPPPLGSQDPTYPAWLAVMRAAEERFRACPPGGETPECQQAREDYFAAAREYAYALDKVYGLNRLKRDGNGAGNGPVNGAVNGNGNGNGNSNGNAAGSGTTARRPSRREQKGT